MSAAAEVASTFSTPGSAERKSVLTVDRLALEAAGPLDQPDGAPPPPTDDSAKPVMSE